MPTAVVIPLILIGAGIVLAVIVVGRRRGRLRRALYVASAVVGGAGLVLLALQPSALWAGR